MAPQYVHAVAGSGIGSEYNRYVKHFRDRNERPELEHDDSCRLLISAKTGPLGMDESLLVTAQVQWGRKVAANDNRLCEGGRIQIVLRLCHSGGRHYVVIREELQGLAMSERDKRVECIWRTLHEIISEVCR